LRDREIELTRSERELYALTAGALDNMIIDSDRLSFLGPAERGLLGQALGLRGGRARVEGLMGKFGEDVYLIDSRRSGGGNARLAVNLSDADGSILGRTVAPRSALRIES
jgi:alpha-galactosidase